MSSHTPIRSCVACRTSSPAAELLRFRRRSDGELVLVTRSSKAVVSNKDERGVQTRKNGRSAYLCPKRSCFDRAMRRDPFQRAFRAKTKLPSDRELFWSQCLATLVEDQAFLYRKHRAAADCDAASFPLPVSPSSISLISGSQRTPKAHPRAVVDRPVSPLESSCDRSSSDNSAQVGAAKDALRGDAISPSRVHTLCAARRAL